MEEPISFSQTQRLVLLIDLHPLFTTTAPSNPNSYINSIISTSQTLLTFPPLSSSLFTFKFFISSLSPLLSESKIRSLIKVPTFINFKFNQPSQTLISLSQALNSINFEFLQSLYSPSSTAKANFTASSICQLMHDYIWESHVDDVIGMPNSNSDESLSIVRSNCVFVFSNVPCLGSFLDLDEIDNVDLICEKFVRVFGVVNDGLVCRDIHCSWIDVVCEEEEENVGKEGSLVVFEKGVKSLGWGFCSTDVIILGSALVPFGMIYPKIGCSLLNFGVTSSEVKVELSLKITDVSGEPLECNCSDLELLELKHLNRRQRREDIAGIWETSYSSGTKSILGNNFGGNEITKIFVKEVWKDIGNLKLNNSSCGYVLLRGTSLEHKADRIDNTSGGFFADMILERLCMEAGEFTSGKPVWPAFLSFLYRNEYSAVVSVSTGADDLRMGILKPFTVHSALLCILDKSAYADDHDLDGFFSSLAGIDTMNSNVMPVGNVDVNKANRSIPNEHEVQFRGKKNHRKYLRSLQNLSRSSLLEAALRNTKMDLEDIYLDGERHISKKTKFLKCWMKQIKKSIRWVQIKANEHKPDSADEEKLKEILPGAEQENDQLVSSSDSTEEPSVKESSDIIGEAVPVSFSENPEDFCGGISQKIQQGLESKELDLDAFAKRLVDSSIYCLYLNHEKESTVVSTAPAEKVEDCGKTIVAELAKLLLREPKDLATKYKGCDQLSCSPETGQPLYTSEGKVREYELQILFRMEILRSKVQGIDEITKLKMVKQICVLLDGIQYHLEGGCFGDVSLDKYVGRTIKDRYSHCLEDVVDRIYTKMDLLLCYDGDGASGSQINSEDGEAQRQKIFDSDTAEHASGSASTSSSTSTKLKENCITDPLTTREKVYQSSLVEAQEKRERASRFLSFTRRPQHLQRVWAPKHPKTMRGKTDSHHKLPKRKEKRGSRCDVVCETPMTERKRSCLRESYVNEKHIGHGMKSGVSVSKALFQDDNGV